MIDLIVPGRPHPAARPRFARVGGGVRTFPGKGDEQAKARVQAAWMAAGRPKMDGRWTAQVLVEVPRPKSHWTSKGNLSAAGRRSIAPPGDVDNYSKIILDALVEVNAVPDDRYCVSLYVVKRWIDRPGLSGGQVRVRVEAA